MKRLGTALALLLAGGLWAANDDPGRGVARVSLTNGDITMQRGDSGDWIAAAVNAPLVRGDKIFAARASRAELQLDSSNFLRIGENTEVRVADLEGRRYQLQISRGILTYRILRQRTADVEINTPAVAVRPLKRGIYRIEVLESGQTEITVRDGEAEIFSSQGNERLDEGRSMVVRPGLDDRAVEVQVLRSAGRDDWDRWNERRDRDLERSRSYRYVHSSVYGVEDLDDYGYWRSIDGYGHCWFPRAVFVGWSPYSHGRWVWVDWYGWTWVGYEPWGWAPYHYGRWFHHARFGWGWYPGPVHVYSYWRPALVGFFGWGGRSGFSFGIGFGYNRIGWVPLAPGEPYYPWYGRGYYGGGRNRVYIDNSTNITNVTNITNIRNVYRNSGVNGGLVGVDTDDFARGRTASLRRVSLAEARNAGQIRGLIPVAPEQESLRVTDRSVRAGLVPRSDGREDRFFTRRQPTPVERVPFAEQQQSIRRLARGETTAEDRRVGRLGGGTAPSAGSSEGGVRSIRSLESGQSEMTRGARRAGEEGSALAPGVPQNNVDRGTGWRRFGDERRASPEAVAVPQNNVDRSTGWRRFGDERRASPEAVTVPQNNVDRGVGGRRFGDEHRASPEAVATPQNNVDRSTGWRRFGDERRVSPEAVAAPQNNVDRGTGWRRFGDERRASPEAVTVPQNNVDRGAGGRRFGDERRASPEAASPPQSFDSSSWRQFGRGEQSGEQRRSIRSLGDSEGASRPQRERPQREWFERREAPRERDSSGPGVRSGGEVFGRRESQGRQDRGGAGLPRLEINRPMVRERAPSHDGGRGASPPPAARQSDGGHQVDRSSGPRSRR